jgi:hypothetical protein
MSRPHFERVLGRKELYRIDIQSAQGFISILGSLASMISASVDIFNLKKPDEPLSNEEKADILLARGRGSTQAPSQVTLRALMVIPERYLDPIRSRLEQFDRDYQTVLTTEGTVMIELKITFDTIANQVCNLLELIKRHNGGELPGGDPFYQELTTTFGCESRPSIFART